MKLTKEIAQQIIDGYKRGDSYAAIAKSSGTSVGTVAKVTAAAGLPRRGKAAGKAAPVTTPAPKPQPAAGPVPPAPTPAPTPDAATEERTRFRKVYQKQGLLGRGLVRRRRGRRTGTHICVYNTVQAGWVPAGAGTPWGVHCEEHDTRKLFAIKEDSLTASRHPARWCAKCAALKERLPLHPVKS